MKNLKKIIWKLLKRCFANMPSRAYYPDFRTPQKCIQTTKGLQSGRKGFVSWQGFRLMGGGVFTKKKTLSFLTEAVKCESAAGSINTLNRHERRGIFAMHWWVNIHFCNRVWTIDTTVWTLAISIGHRLPVPVIHRTFKQFCPLVKRDCKKINLHTLKKIRCHIRIYQIINVILFKLL